MVGLPAFAMVKVCFENHKVSNAVIVNLAYWVVCLSVVGTVIFSWSFVLEISTSSPGLIRPFSGISSVRCGFNGHIKKSFLRENQFVNAGDTLYTIETDALIIRKKYLSDKLNEINEIIADLSILTNNSVEEKRIHSAQLVQSRITYLQKMVEAKTQLKKAQTDYKRNLRLHDEKVIADVEFETYKYALDRANNEVEITRKTQMNQWQIGRASCRERVWIPV